TAQDFRINTVALRSYLEQVRAACAQVGGLPDMANALLAQVLALPGVVPEPGQTTSHLHDDWPALEKVLIQALDKLQTMRQEEGKAMAQELLAHRDHIAAHLAKIRARTPQVATLFRDRLLERVRQL